LLVGLVPTPPYLGNWERTVVGLDISEGQIQIARGKEETNPLGIEYIIGDVLTYDFTQGEPSDIATAVFLFDYAASRDELQKMCRSAYFALKENGRLMAILDNRDAGYLRIRNTRLL
jgi:SAM-dependent methyltransferase